MDARTQDQIAKPAFKDQAGTGRADVRVADAGKRGWFALTPINRRRWQNFKANRRGYWSLWVFLVLFFLTLFAEFIANDRPILVSYKGEILAPVVINYP
ncbi:MAG: hypothetical protein AAFZ05_15175, partial [Pseudomonadota bacterium]